MDETKLKINQVWYQNNYQGVTKRVIRILARHPDKTVSYGIVRTQWIYQELGGTGRYANVPKKIWYMSEGQLQRQLQHFGTYKEFLKKKEEHGVL